MAESVDNSEIEMQTGSDTTATEDAGSNGKLSEQKKRMVERSVYLQGMSAGTSKESIQAEFSKFGKIRRVILDYVKQAWAFVEFDSNDIAQKCIGQEVKIGETTIKAEPRSYNPRRQKPPGGRFSRSPRRKKSKKNNTTHPNPIEALRTRPDMLINQESLAKAASVEEQMQRLIESLELTATEVGTRETVIECLTSLFKPYFPECSLHQFGSSASGIGIRGSDLDAFVDLGLEKQIQIGSQRAKPFPFVYGVKDSELEITNLKQSEASRIVRILSTILKTPEADCKLVTYISKARVPLVKFCHTASGLVCDLTLNNRLAVQNTRLIQVYQKVDPRVRPLLFTIRHWAKQRDVTGDINTGRHISNYALTLIVLFYLQATKPPVLPSVEIMSDLSSPEEELTLDDWDVGFCLDPLRLPLTENQETVEELLVGFYRFYNRLAFPRVVLSVRKGAVIPKSQFTPHPAEESRHRFKMAYMNVQDPFNLNHNTTQNMNEFIHQKWVMSIDAALELCTSPVFQSPAVDQPWGLLALCADIQANEKAERASLHPAQWQFYIDLHMRTSEPCLDEITDKEKKQAVWLNKVSKLFVHVLSKIFKIEFHHLESDVPDIRSHVEGKQDEQEMASKDTKDPASLPKDLKKPLLFGYCSSVYTLWVGRKQVMKELQTAEKKEESLELEENISKVLAEKKELKTQFPMLFEAAVLQQRKGNKVAASFRFLPHGSEAHFVGFFSFLKLYIYHIITKHLASV